MHKTRAYFTPAAEFINSVRPSRTAVARLDGSLLVARDYVG
ncbi:MAG TPA: hypothetical protein VNP04_19170 [Alphaproteobacteria bacterium]|nr:hypothetical protein [Alphaproteobacteria bacterium]